MLLGIIELTLLKTKHFLHLFLWLEIFLPTFLFRSKLFFFRHCRGIQFFNLIRWQSKSLIWRKKVTEKNFKSSDYVFNILSPVNVKANFNFAIHQSKSFVVILVNTFYVSSLMLVKKQWSFGIKYMSAAYFLIGDSGTLG